ncbi:hypothetical protein SPRG_05186 [Saprolegnia parasitica CBS 223.65]|uniref:GP-PDE domain-containing protein n=1 Tax=Saprolegnia parasitica (strain CBS 223.65) TaxID=695850 RepID=A0A067CT67_SAPPC|nr:hypothetical protein SPRG_05186 [Saprolegnia parasitica CBS 223.65]KDO29997.1 hypothetical protein SPRG_05186 [Saprolegnia parasitica CBS 223.65]|eukprot:XP_012199180.1 hypothetical protein SPRG_05186 [Saprolegnia parasitica CBS 223.65]
MLDELAEETTSPDVVAFAPYEATNAHLPPCLSGGAVHVVAEALRLVASIDVSRRILTETSVLTTSAISFLGAWDQRASLLAAYVAHNEARSSEQAALRARATDIQRKWLHVKFRAIDHPARFEPPEIYPYLDADDASAPEVDDDLLTQQIAQYKVALDKRVADTKEARRQEALAVAQQQKVTALRRRREAHAERHRLENIQHRWEYLVNLALRRDHVNRLRRAKSAAVADADDDDDDDDERPTTYLAAKLFVERTLHTATLHAMWAVEMQSLASPPPELVTSDAGPVLRLCMLLCPNPFGAQFSALYQRYFAREGATIGVHFEWRVFDVGQLEFPTVALDEWAHGYLVCGGPGRENASPLWHRSVVAFVAHVVGLHRRVGALGRGHRILAEALGGHVTCASPCRLDWNVFEEKVLSQQSIKTMVYAIPALHGDVVTSVPSAKVATSTPGAAHYVTTFKTKTALSFDGHPECGPFILHMLARYLQAPATDDSSAIPECPWPSGNALVARKLLQHFLVAHKGQEDTESVLSRRLPERRMRVFAHKTADPMLEFVSDTNEYLSFASSENVDVVVLPICLSSDKHPIVFDSTRLESLTDLASVYPSYVHAIPPRVAISDLSLAELKALSSLHASPNASLLKSPRGRGGHAGESNRLQTLTSVLQFIARLNAAQQSSPLEVAFMFPEENDATFSAHDCDRIRVLYTTLSGALRVLHTNMDDAVHVISRDIAFLHTLHKLHPRWRTVLALPRSIATPLRMTVQHDASAIAHFADAILIPKSHPVLLPDQIDSLAQIYHRAGVHVYVDLNDPYPTSLSLVKEHIKCLCLRVDGVFISNPRIALDGFRRFASGHSYVDEVYEDIRQSFSLVAALAEHEKLQRQQEPQAITYAHHAYKFPGSESESWSQRLRHLPPVMDHVAHLVEVDADVEMERQVRGNFCSAPKRTLPARPVTGRPLLLAVTAPVLGASQQVLLSPIVRKTFAVRSASFRSTNAAPSHHLASPHS